MTDHAVIHATFTLERIYPVPPGRVFSAWADPESKGRWFAGPDSGHQLDFRVGGHEVNHAQHNGVELIFESLYRDIVADQRIVCTSVLTQDDCPAAVSLTTVELHQGTAPGWCSPSWVCSSMGSSNRPGGNKAPETGLMLSASNSE